MHTFTKYKWISLLLLAFLTVACQLISSKSSDSQVVSTGEGSEQDPSRPHPKGKSAWDVQILLMKAEGVDKSKVDVCKANILESEKLAQTQKLLTETAKNFEIEVSQDPQIHHWCYYILKHELAIYLDDEALSLFEKSKYFYTQTKKLWILAAALQRVTGDPVYLESLKTSYIKISQEYFGQKLEPFGPPLSFEEPSQSDFEAE